MTTASTKENTPSNNGKNLSTKKLWSMKVRVEEALQVHNQVLRRIQSSQMGQIQCGRKGELGKVVVVKIQKFK